MTSKSNLPEMSPQDREAYGIARVKDLAYEAVLVLWRMRQAEGLSQAELAARLNRDEGWLSRNLRGPANWTFKTFGAMVEALDGEAEIKAHPIEEPLPELKNYDAYSGYEIDVLKKLAEVPPPPMGGPYRMKSPTGSDRNSVTQIELVQ